MEDDRKKGREEMSFFCSAVSESAGWYEPKFVCDMQCRKEGFKFYDIASIMVEDDGEPHTINFCMKCYNLRLEEEGANGRRQATVGDKSS